MAHWRIAAGLTQEEVAQKIGIDRSAIAQWETGRNIPRADRFPQLAKLYGCSTDDLFKVVEDENDAGQK